MATQSALLVPVRDWPAFTWSFVAYIVWLHCSPPGWAIDSTIGKWLMPWAGYYAFHPCHDGMSMAEVEAKALPT